MKLFFNEKKEKVTEHKPNEKRSFAFTDKEVRNLPCDLKVAYSDTLCPGLRVMVSHCGNHSYIYKAAEGSKVIGSIYSISLKQAREIVNNIRENRDEYLSEFKNIKMHLFGYFQKFGPYPHEKLDKADIEDDQKGLKDYIETLRAENDKLVERNIKLNEENEYLTNMLTRIRDIINSKHEVQNG